MRTNSWDDIVDCALGVGEFRCDDPHQVTGDPYLYNVVQSVRSGVPKEEALIAVALAMSKAMRGMREELLRQKQNCICRPVSR